MRLVQARFAQSEEAPSVDPTRAGRRDWSSWEFVYRCWWRRGWTAGDPQRQVSSGEIVAAYSRVLGAHDHRRKNDRTRLQKPAVRGC